MQNSKEEQILNVLRLKASLKQTVSSNTYATLNLLKKVLKDIENHYNTKLSDTFKKPIFEYKEISKFQIQLRVAGDVLMFYMHTNVFEFDREHQVWKVNYVKENDINAYSG